MRFHSSLTRSGRKEPYAEEDDAEREDEDDAKKKMQKKEHPAPRGGPEDAAKKVKSTSPVVVRGCEAHFLIFSAPLYFWHKENSDVTYSQV